MTPPEPFTMVVDYQQTSGRWRTDERADAASPAEASQTFDGYAHWSWEGPLGGEVEIRTIEEGRRGSFSPGTPYSAFYQPGLRNFIKASYALEGTTTILGRLTERYAKIEQTTLRPECAQRLGVTSMAQRKEIFFLDAVTGVPLGYRVMILGAVTPLEDYMATSLVFDAPTSTDAYQIQPPGN